MSLNKPQGYMYSALTSMIEFYRHSSYYIIISDRVNPYDIYAILYSSPAYGNSSIFAWLGYLIQAFIWSLIFILFFAQWYFIMYFITVRLAIWFLFVLFLYISCFLIASQSTIDMIFNSMSQTDTICTGVACKKVWYVLHTVKAVADRISNQV